MEVPPPHFSLGSSLLIDFPPLTLVSEVIGYMSSVSKFLILTIYLFARVPPLYVLIRLSLACFALPWAVYPCPP